MAAALVVAGLLGGTAAAFAYTEHLKLERSPVLRTHVGANVPCLRCGYNLRGLEPRGRCPECVATTSVSSGAHARERQ